MSCNRFEVKLKEFEFYVSNPGELRKSLLEYWRCNEFSFERLSSIMSMDQGTLRGFIKEKRKTSHVTIIKVYNFLEKSVVNTDIT